MGSLSVINNTAQLAGGNCGSREPAMQRNHIAPKAGVNRPPVAFLVSQALFS